MVYYLIRDYGLIYTNGSEENAKSQHIDKIQSEKQSI